MFRVSSEHVQLRDTVRKGDQVRVEVLLRVQALDQQTALQAKREHQEEFTEFSDHFF